MANTGSSSIERVHKERIRKEIDAQIEKYLQAGGVIDVLNKEGSTQGHERGSVWHGPDEFAEWLE